MPKLQTRINLQALGLVVVVTGMLLAAWRQQVKIGRLQQATRTT